MVFTDEKRFSLDGPDSWSTYTDENRNIYRNMRQNKGGGIMIWGMITFDGYLHVIQMIGNFNSSAYCSIIIDEMKPLLDDMFGSEQYYFQQDNCRIHVSEETMSHFRELSLQTIEWPARSPDLNIIENVWSIMVNYIYMTKNVNSIHFKSCGRLSIGRWNILTSREPVMSKIYTIRFKQDLLK